MSAFYKKLQQATNEDKQVNELYKHELRKQFNKLKDDEYDCQLLTIDIDNPIYLSTDGIFPCTYLESDNYYLPFYLLMECKLDKDFNIPEQKAEVLVQVIAYLAQIYYANFVDKEWQRNKARDKFKNILKIETLDKIERMPSTVFVGSKTTCFAVSNEQLKQYYMMGLDFDSIRAASTFKNTPQGELIYNSLLRDTMLDATSPVFNTSDKYCIEDIVDLIYRYNKNIKDADDLTARNLYRAFTRFTTRVLSKDSVEKLSNRQQASLLAQFIVNRKAIKIETDLDGTLQGLIVNGLNVQVDTREWNTFSWIYNLKEYGADEQKKITAITDQLISEDDRRRKGDFYTPSIWVEEAHKLLDKNLGENWRDEYMVWDCAWGTGNLTRDCTKLNGTYISDLYCSTLHETDLEIAQRYNVNATKFQYDFLNDDVENMEQIHSCMQQAFKMREYNPTMAQTFVDQANAILFNTKLYQQAPGLIDGLLGINGKPKKKLLFLINPPYGTSGEMVRTGREKKKGIAVTAINEIMAEDGMGACRQQLYAQFMYRIHKLSKLFNCDVSLGIFAPTLYMCSKTFKKLYNNILNGRFKDGFMLQASQFADVKGNWAISFCLWGNNGQDVDLQVKEYVDNKIETVEIKRHGFTEKTITDFIKSDKDTETKKEKTFTMSNALKVTDGECTISEGNMGYLVADSTIVEKNTQYVMLIPRKLKGHLASFEIKVKNFDKICTAFTARRLITGEYCNWINSKDEYMIPNTSHPDYKQWQSDCIVYSLFNTASNQSSLRNISYNGKQWNIQNEFFWMSVKDIADLATGRSSAEDSNVDVCDDIERFGDNRFVYKKLQEVTLSPDAQAVLDKATELVKSSFKYRKDFNQKHPEYHINTWDAGWYQIKGLLKEYDPNGLKELNALYKEFEDRMRPLVYELGFLYK